MSVEVQVYLIFLMALLKGAKYENYNFQLKAINALLKSFFNIGC